jgi:hypothetical protein
MAEKTNGQAQRFSWRNDTSSFKMVILIFSRQIGRLRLCPNEGIGVFRNISKYLLKSFPTI